MLQQSDIKEIKEAFQALMGMNGDSFVQEIINTEKLSERSYEAIKSNIYFNGRESIQQYFGLVHYYYLRTIWNK